MPKETKVGQVELDNRVNTIIELLSEGLVRRDILQYVSKKTDWGIQWRQVDHYIKEANKRLLEESKKDVHEFRADVKNKLIKLYKKANKKDDHAECRRILETMNKILGYEKVTVDVNAREMKIVLVKDLDKIE